MHDDLCGIVDGTLAFDETATEDPHHDRKLGLCACPSGPKDVQCEAVFRHRALNSALRYVSIEYHHGCYAQLSQIPTCCWAHAGPNCVASKDVTFMESTETGGIKRKLPTGGSANGSPGEGGVSPESRS